jgi:hypothetical protein
MTETENRSRIQMPNNDVDSTDQTTTLRSQGERTEIGHDDLLLLRRVATSTRTVARDVCLPSARAWDRIAGATYDRPACIGSRAWADEPMARPPAAPDSRAPCD